MSKANMQSAIKKLSIGMLIIASLSLTSCANTAQKKNTNQSKQRTIVSYLA
jgi:outer membrane biogenesis lipoprotein LolB